MTVESGAAGSLARMRIERGCCLLGVLRVNAPDTGMRTEDIIVAAIVIVFVIVFRGMFCAFCAQLKWLVPVVSLATESETLLAGLSAFRGLLPEPSFPRVLSGTVGTSSVSNSPYKQVLPMACVRVSSRNPPLRAMNALASVLGGYPGGQRLLHALTCISEPPVRDEVAAGIAAVLGEAGRVESTGGLCLLTWHFPYQANHA